MVKQSPSSKKSFWFQISALLVFLAIAVWRGLIFWKLWNDKGCIQRGWSSCQLHVGSPQVLLASDIQQFEQTYGSSLLDTVTILQNWLSNPRTVTMPCTNHHIDCTYLAATGRCDVVPNMQKSCALACQYCPNNNNDDDGENDGSIPMGGNNHEWSLCVIHPSSCIVEQYTLPVASQRYQAAFHKLVADASTYLRQLAADPEISSDVRDILPYCVNRYLKCTDWAFRGMCHGPQRFHDGVDDMLIDCAVACHSCEHLLDEE